MRCLGGDDLAVYLCCHAAEDAFFRLKWLADIARLIEGWSAAEVDALIARARAVGAERHVMLSFVMLERFGCAVAMPRGGEIEAETARLANWATAAIRAPERGQERFRFADVPADLRVLAYGLRLSRGWRSKSFKVLRHLTNHQDMSTLKLGAEWQLVYALLGRPMALGRWVARAYGRGRRGGGRRSDEKV